MEPRQWESVLKLANLWQFHAVRRNAIRQLQAVVDGISAQDAIAMARKYDVDKWLIDGVEIMAKRSEPLCVEDVQVIGIEDALKVAHVREQTMHILKSTSRGSWVDWKERSALNFRPTIKIVFGIPDVA